MRYYYVGQNGSDQEGSSQGKVKKMARRTETIVDTTGTQLTPLEDIPQDVRDFVEELYTKQRKVPSRERVFYDSKKERDDEYKLMVDYGKQRAAGVLKVRASPIRAENKPKNVDPDTVLDVRVSADVEANGARNAGNDRRQPVGQK